MAGAIQIAGRVCVKIQLKRITMEHGGIHLAVYRPRERKFSLPGNAYSTPSGFWIVNIPGKPADVVDCASTAADQLIAYYAARENAYD
jgi:hypothetical protein